MKLRTIGVSLLCIASATLLPAQTFHLLHSFNGTDGANPYVGVVQGTDGNFYGTTIDGGANAGGNVVRITTGGKVTSLYDFCSQADCTDGQYPSTVLVQGADGNFYGTTQSGGKHGAGTVFAITPNGVLTTLHSFNGKDGAGPYGSLVLATNGAFFGTTNGGGAHNSGTVFTITTSGALTILYTFCSQKGCTDGQYPVGPLIQASDGNIYGTTHAGGSYADCSVNGCGTIFKITLTGELTTLHTFDATHGEYPYGGVVEGAKKTFYGTTGSGGAYSYGTIFTVKATGAFRTLYDFNGTDGRNPYAILLGSDGNFYGTTLYGGVHSKGSVFEITPDGTLTNLHSFDGKHGKNPYSGLVQDTNGAFYGTAYFGGAADDGIFFSLSASLPPFVVTQPISGAVGAPVTILGTNLKGATAVSFNGKPAEFTVVSGSEITTTVPAGATTGNVTVTTPKDGTLKSNVAFRVTR